jgi:hypothetical protein
MKKTIKKMQAMLVPRSNGEGICFSMDAISGESALYELLSDFIYNQSNELDHDLAYNMTGIALDVISEVLTYNETDAGIADAISEQCDGFTPIYYNELGEFIKNNVTLIDEIKEEFGSDGKDTYKDAQVACYVTLERITNALYEELKQYAESEE